MALEALVNRLKPALDTFLKNNTKVALKNLQHALNEFNWSNFSVINMHILIPIVLKLEHLTPSSNQEFRTGCLDCIALVVSKMHLKELTALRSILAIVLKQLRDNSNGQLYSNLSEEMKLSAVQCIGACLKSATSDVLEQLYSKDSAMLLGQLLLTLVEFIELEKYKKLILTSMDTLMIVFYVHDMADELDYVFRYQVANTLFIFLPKVITVLCKRSLSDVVVGDTIKMVAIKALGRILCIIFEDNIHDNRHGMEFNAIAFKDLLKGSTDNQKDDIFTKKGRGSLVAKLKELQTDGRTLSWYRAAARKLSTILGQMCILRSHTCTQVRYEYCKMNCNLLMKCLQNFKCDLIYILESVLALSEDQDEQIRTLSTKTIQNLQTNFTMQNIFEEYSQILWDEHLIKLPRIISRCNDQEQYAEFLFLKAFLNNLNSNQLQLIFSEYGSRNMELFSRCLFSAVDLHLSVELLNEEHSLRCSTINMVDNVKLIWRNYNHLHLAACVQLLTDICHKLGQIPIICNLLMDYFLEQLEQQKRLTNEILLIIIWFAMGDKTSSSDIVISLLEELLKEHHWHLLLQPDNSKLYKCDKPSNYYMDATPGLYESSIEIRKQDYDSDDELKDDSKRVTSADAQFNILHTCLVLDGLGHCAKHLKINFKSYVFRTLHKVLLKLADSNFMIHQAAKFALISIRKALRFDDITLLINEYMDYISYHLNSMLRKTNDECKGAIDMLTILLQLSTRNTLSYFEVIFETIYDQCCTIDNNSNIISYLRVFAAFIRNIKQLQMDFEIKLEMDIKQHQIKTNSDQLSNQQILFENWLNILQKSQTIPIATPSDDKPNDQQELDTTEDFDENQKISNINNEIRPIHIDIVKKILYQVVKFINSKRISHQILALECLIGGLPLLQNYENYLLPLVHAIWKPFIAKCRQEDPLVLNRCFTLFSTLAETAKDFIAKRSSDDIIEYLKAFLLKTLQHTTNKTSVHVQTQEYKLQLKLLENYGDLIQNLAIIGRNLYELADIISLYLSKLQPLELQNRAIQSLKQLFLYNGPMIYFIVLQRSHLEVYEQNANNLLKEFLLYQ